jgi:hypothetical protein
MAPPQQQIVEILNVQSSAFAATTAWTNVTGDIETVLFKTPTGFGSTRSGSPAIDEVAFVVNNSALGYNPDVFGYASNSIVENGNRIRLRSVGANLGYCMQVSFAGGSPNAGTVSQVYTAVIGAATVWTLTYQARSQYDFIGNTDTVTLKSNLADITTTTPTYGIKWTTYTVNLTISATPAASLTVQVAPGVNTVGNQYIEYKNFSLTCPSVNGGLNVLTNSSFSTGLLTPWTAAGLTGTTVTAAVLPDSYIGFNGLITSVAPDFAKYGTAQTVISASTFIYTMQTQKMNPPLAIQSNRSSNYLIGLLMTYMQPSRSTKLWPAQQVDTGRLTSIGVAFDKYTAGGTVHAGGAVTGAVMGQGTLALNAIDDIVNSEMGFFWQDLDGTVRFASADYAIVRQQSTPKLTLSDGMAFAVTGQRTTQTVINNVICTYHPRNVAAGTQVLWSAPNSITIPGNTASGPGTVTVTAPYSDPYGNPAGATATVTPVATTDYIINERADGSGVDYTTFGGYFTITVTFLGAQATIVMNNTASGPLQTVKLQLRGTPVTTYSPQQVNVSDATSITRYQQHDLNKDLPFTDNQLYASSLAQYYIAAYKNPFLELTSVTVQNKSSINGVDLMSLNIGDTISVVSTQSNMPTRIHTITSISYGMTPNSGAGSISSWTAQLRGADNSHIPRWGDGVWTWGDGVSQWWI